MGGVLTLDAGRDAAPDLKKVAWAITLLLLLEEVRLTGKFLFEAIFNNSQSEICVNL